MTARDMPRPPAGFGDEPGDELVNVLKRVAAALVRADVPFALTGGYAVYARGGGLSEHDVDFLITERDVETVTAALVEAGFDIVRPPEDWLIKAYDRDRLVDLIFRPVQRPVTAETLADSQVLPVEGSHMPVMSATMLMAYKLLSMHAHRCDFAPSLELARVLREQIDWPRLRLEVAGSPYAAAFLVLVIELGIVEDKAGQDRLVDGVDGVDDVDSAAFRGMEPGRPA